MEQTSRDKSSDYDVYMYGSVATSLAPITLEEHMPGTSSSNDIVVNTNHEISHGVPSNGSN